MDYKSYLYNEIPLLVEQIDENATAKWGQMNAHQMVEHLALVLSIANGRKTVTANADAEKLAYRKMRFFEKDAPFPKGIRLEVIPENPVPPMFPTIQESKQFFMSQLQRFMDYHEEHEGLTPTHPVLGPLNYEEWVRFQARHIKHHLEQFGVLEESF